MRKGWVCRSSSPWRSRARAFLAGMLAAAGLTGFGGVVAARADGPCATPSANPIPCENSQPGTDPFTWRVVGAGDPGIQGFATDISVNVGGTISFKVKTDSANYSLTIYRLGWYQGNGARQMAVVQPSAPLPQTQPACLTDPPTGLVDCGNWAVSASWTVPTDAVSGVYFARVADNDTGAASQIWFVVRNDASTSDLLFKTNDTTWEAYNDYGGSNVYYGLAPSSDGRAYKVSYNRPFRNRSEDPGFGTANLVLYAEVPMIRWLESNGYDVSYTSSIDVERNPSLLTHHRVLTAAGHDEYWSAGERSAITAARDAGVNLAFFTGNEDYWKIRWENAIDGSGTPYRTLVTYKESLDNRRLDPQDPPSWTGTWRDPRWSPPADGGQPENALGGTIFTVNRGSGTPVIGSNFSALRFWRNTAVSRLAPGQTVTLSSNSIGYEWDEDLDNGFRPAGLFDLSATPLTVTLKLQDYGRTVTPGTAVHSMTMYRASSGALVFGAGTVQWAWGLDTFHDTAPDVGATTTDLNMQQATLNVYADMGVQPATIQPGLVATTASTDTTPPASSVTGPAPNGSFVSGTPTTITGTAADSGGGVVAGVEVSVDGGATWHKASGTSSWSYAWTPGTPGATTIRSRAVDDSGRLETPPAGVPVTVTPRACPCTLLPASATPGTPSTQDASALELGVKFTSDIAGSVLGVRFYKGTGNSGTHTGHLWTAAGTLLASGTFTGESPTGWQTLTFSSPVPIQAGTTYVASYHTDTGFYASDTGYFTRSIDAWPLHAPLGLNGVFAAGGPQFPTQSFNAVSYWVDVVFNSMSATSTALASSPSPSVTGQAVTLTATVTGASGGAPGGAVAFMEGTQQLGTAALDGASPGHATFTTSALAVGDHPVTAVYAGSAGFSGSTSAVLTHHVGPAQTTTVVTASPSPSVFGRPVTLTATVTAVAPGAGVPAGSVVFTDGSTTLGTAPLAVTGGADRASITTSALAGGSHTIRAAYQGSGAFAASTSAAITQVVQAAATSMTAAPALLSLLTLSATLKRTDDGTAVAGQTIRFTAGSTSVCSATTNASGVASCSGLAAALLIVLAGGYNATFAGTANFGASSAHGGILTGGLTASPAVAANGPWFNEEQVLVSNSSTVTALSVGIAVQRTNGVSYSGQYETVGNPSVVSDHGTTTSLLTYEFDLGSGRTLPAGSWTFAAQSGGTGTTHPTSGDTWSVTYTTAGTTYTQNGHF